MFVPISPAQTKKFYVSKGGRLTCKQIHNIDNFVALNVARKENAFLRESRIRKKPPLASGFPYFFRT